MIDLNIYCFPKDIPKDCHDAKMNYKVKKNSVMYIDVDGPAPVPGNSSLVNLPPVLVYCDVESYKHVGVTVIPAQEPSGTPTQPGAQPITYPVDTQVLLILTHMSGFCMQGLTYICEVSVRAVLILLMVTKTTIERCPKGNNIVVRSDRMYICVTYVSNYWDYFYIQK